MRSPLILATFFAGAKASEDGLQMNEVSEFEYAVA